MHVLHAYILKKFVIYQQITKQIDFHRSNISVFSMNPEKMRLSVNIVFGGAIGSASASAEGTGFETHCGHEFFILYFSFALCSLQLEQALQMKSTMIYN